MDPYTAIQAAASWTSVSTDVVLVGVALAAVVVIMRGSRLLLSFIRR